MNTSASLGHSDSSQPQTWPGGPGQGLSCIRAGVVAVRFLQCDANQSVLIFIGYCWSVIKVTHTKRLLKTESGTIPWLGLVVVGLL